MTETSGERDIVCPSWCELPPDHVAGSGAAGEATHRRVVREIVLGKIEAIRDAADAPLRVEVEAYSRPRGPGAPADGAADPVGCLKPG